ncbi:MAG TPA: peroxiredoxin [bacterium]
MSEPGAGWSGIPAPAADGAAAHLPGLALPALALPATDGRRVALAALPGRTVVYAYPRTSRPDDSARPAGWDRIPGAKGCTPQSCAFRDRHTELLGQGVGAVFGLSVQDRTYQREAVQRLQLPFALLSDERGELTAALRLPTFQASGMTLLKRLTLILRDGRVERVFYPVFPPDRNAQDVLDWLAAHPL